jgi:hypothetical protein
MSCRAARRRVKVSSRVWYVVVLQFSTCCVNCVANDCLSSRAGSRTMSSCNRKSRTNRHDLTVLHILLPLLSPTFDIKRRYPRPTFYNWLSFGLEATRTCALPFTHRPESLPLLTRCLGPFLLTYRCLVEAMILSWLHRWFLIYLFSFSCDIPFVVLARIYLLFSP